MNTIFMNFEKSILSDFYRLLINLSNKINLQISDEYVALSNLGRYYTWKYVKVLYKNNKFKKSNPTWDDKAKLPDGSYSV